MATTISSGEVRSSAVSSSAQVTAAMTSSWIWLLAAAVCFMFSNGVNNIALAAWLGPLFLLRFLRTKPVAMGLFIAYCVLIAARAFSHRGMIPIPGVYYYIFLVISGVSAVMPYLLDRLITGRISGFAKTCVFPAALVTVEFLSFHGPTGSWSSSAYSQYGNLPLLQLLAVCGLSGITFLIGWFAAVANSIWEQGLAPRAMRWGAVFGAVYLSIILVGEARLGIFPPSSATVRVASLSRPRDGSQLREAVYRDVRGNKGTVDEIAEYSAWTKLVDDDLLARTENEARTGARIVFWAEENAPVLRQDEAALISRAGETALRDGIYIGMALESWDPAQPKPLENKLVLVKSDGQVAWQYVKSHPTPGPEADLSSERGSRLRSLSTPYGILSAMICYDADFPPLAAQSGAFGADIMLDPASDWRAIDPWHTQMASFRAIEQGFNLVRQTKFGLSAAYDYQGRRLAAMDESEAKDFVLVAEVPTRGVRTIYSRVGDWLVWLCIAGLFVLIAYAWRGQPRAAVAT